MKTNPITAIRVIGAAALALILSMFAGWVSHVIWTFNQENITSLLLGILGCIVAPIGAFHGIYTWF